MFRFLKTRGSSETDQETVREEHQHVDSRKCDQPLICKKHLRVYDKRCAKIKPDVLQECKKAVPEIKISNETYICNFCNLRLKEHLKKGSLRKHLRSEFLVDGREEVPTSSSPKGILSKFKSDQTKKRPKPNNSDDGTSIPIPGNAATAAGPDNQVKTRRLSLRTRGLSDHSTSDILTQPSHPIECLGGSCPGPSTTESDTSSPTTKKSRQMRNAVIPQPTSSQNIEPNIACETSEESNDTIECNQNEFDPDEDPSSPSESFSSDRGHSPSESSWADEEDASEIQLMQLNIALEALGIRTITEKCRSDSYRLKQTFRTALKALEDRFEQVSPFVNVTANEKARKCPKCDWLVAGLKQAFSAISSKREKYLLLTCIPSIGRQRLMSLMNCTDHMAKTAISTRDKCGPFSAPTYKSSAHPISQIDINTVIAYYQDDSNSRVSPRMSDTIIVKNRFTGEKQRVAKRRMLWTLRELFVAFKQENYTGRPLVPKIGISKFASLRPKNCVWSAPNNFHNSCTCVIHENFGFLMDALGEDRKHVGSFLGRFLCNVPSQDCYLGFCIGCPNFDYLETNYDLDENVTFKQWECTDRTNVHDVSYDFNDFKSFFKKQLVKISAHHFVMKEQKQYIQSVKSDLKTEGSILIQADFAENYRYVIQDAVQGLHWSNESTTIHPFVVFYPGYWDSGNAIETEVSNEVRFKTFVAISDTTEHSAWSYHCFLSRMITDFGSQDIFCNAFKIYYLTDGASSQYKNKTNFYNAMMHKKDFHKDTELIFFATAHGKGQCDAISGVVKRQLRIESLTHGRIITSSLEVYEFCKRRLTSEKLEFFHVTKQEVEIHKLKYGDRNTCAETIKGTRKFHSFEPIQESMRCRFTSTHQQYHDHDYTNISTEMYVPGDFVAMRLSHGFAIAEITHVELIEDDDREFTVRVMLQSGSGNCFIIRPDSSAKQIFESDIIMHVHSPTLTGNGYYTIPEVTFTSLSADFASRSN